MKVFYNKSWVKTVIKKYLACLKGLESFEIFIHIFSYFQEIYFRNDSLHF